MRVAVASGKGGTGKTLVSTNLFWAAQKAGQEVSIIDCDAEEPNVVEFVSGEEISTKLVKQKIPVIDTNLCTYCNKCREYCNYNAIICLPPVKFIQVIEELCHDCGACFVACEAKAISEKDKTIGKISEKGYNMHARVIEGCTEVGVFSSVPVIKESIKQAANAPCAIFDSPPGISCPFIATVESSDFVVLVTEPTHFGLNDLLLSVETLEYLGKPFGVIINRAGIGNSDVYNWLKNNKVPLLMEIPFDREIARVYSEGKLIAEELPLYATLFSQLMNTIEKTIKQQSGYIQ
ncbi:MAG: ATP-binding protein [Bacteroidales bacterium]|nr:ATP-binding protein [Bacteroidales bacterium]